MFALFLFGWFTAMSEDETEHYSPDSHGPREAAELARE
jgi:hypothetical protein